jgi:parallel beta-helix repeat protein
MESHAFDSIMATAWAAFWLVATVVATTAEPPPANASPETVSAAMCGGGESVAFAPQVHVVPPSPHAHHEIQERIIDSLPGDVIQLEAGRYQLPRQIDVAAAGLTIRGRGPNETVLSFKGQVDGGQGIEATGDGFTLESLAIEDTAGNAVKVLGATDVTLRDVRVEWTGPPSPDNGGYGLYPVQCANVLIEKCTAFGASDSGIYVGQSRRVVVRECRAERNVAGIEIENTIDADVHDNIATNNTGGVLVFDLPGLQIKAGKNVRVFHNEVVDNNHRNFADAGSVVSNVPQGTGVMVLAMDHVEVFDNRIAVRQAARRRCDGVCRRGDATVSGRHRDGQDLFLPPRLPRCVARGAAA